MTILKAGISTLI